MFERAILPDLRARMAAAGETAVIASRVLRTWGSSESALAEALGERFDALDHRARPRARHHRLPGQRDRGHQGAPHRPRRGPRPRPTRPARRRGEPRCGRSSRQRLGDIVFGVDDESMEDAVAEVLLEHGLTPRPSPSRSPAASSPAALGQRPGRRAWFRGWRRRLRLGGEASAARCARGPGRERRRPPRPMAEGARTLLGADVGLGVTGVAGPDEQDGQRARHGLRRPRPSPAVA